MATDQVLESCSVPHGRLLKLGVNDVWLANDMTYKKTKHTTNTTKSVCIQCMVAHTVLLAGRPHIHIYCTSSNLYTPDTSLARQLALLLL